MRTTHPAFAGPERSCLRKMSANAPMNIQIERRPEKDRDRGEEDVADAPGHVSISSAMQLDSRQRAEARHASARDPA